MLYRVSGVLLSVWQVSYEHEAHTCVTHVTSGCDTLQSALLTLTAAWNKSTKLEQISRCSEVTDEKARYLLDGIFISYV